MAIVTTSQWDSRDKILVALGVLVIVALCLVLYPSRNLAKTYHWVRSEPEQSPHQVASGPAPSFGSSQETLFAMLSQVMDPEIPVNIVELGLVYSASLDSGRVKVVMTLTSPTCPYGSNLIEGVKKVLFSDPSIRELDLKLTFDPPWNMSMISPEVRAKFFHIKPSSESR